MAAPADEFIEVDGPDMAATPVRRYWDPAFSTDAVRVLPGNHYVTARSEMIVTLLGSCVSACVRDPKIGIGGLNHFLLPGDRLGQAANDGGKALRYGSYAMERLINDILRAGGQRGRLEVKVFGGGNVTDSSSTIGHSNADFVVDYLKEEGLGIAAKHLKGELPRRIHYFPRTGKVYMQLLRKRVATDILRSEKAYERRLSETPISGEIELFD